MPAEVTVAVRNLVKRYGKFEAVKGISFEVFAGEIFGFLGPNGAGKTTTIYCITGILRPTAGEIKVLGMDMPEQELEVKRRIGLVFEQPRLYSGLTGREFVQFVMEVYGLDDDATKRFEKYAEAFGIDFLDAPISEYSHGMKQKLALASVLMREPEILFLDEPFMGLDAKSVKALKDILIDYARKGKTVFLTTHIMEIAEKLCDRIAIMSGGKIAAIGTMEELKAMSRRGHGMLESVFLELTGEEVEGL